MFSRRKCSSLDRFEGGESEDVNAKVVGWGWEE